MLLLAIVLAGYWGLRKSSLLSQADAPAVGHAPGGPAAHTGDAARILELLETQRWHLQPDVSIDQLAAALQLPARRTSEIINQQLNKSFFDLINSYRIVEAQRLLTRAEQPRITVLEVMYAVGFNSKSSFHSAFKRYTGMTPSQYRKRVDN